GPTSPTITIAGGAAYTTSGTVALTLGASDSPTEMYLTNTAGCSGSNWESYATSKAAWPLGQTNATATVYAKFRDALGNESSCVNDTIVHDDQNPNDPSGLTLGSVPPSTTTTPSITFT